ncbi:hypothetical protein MLD38_017454 [Melastoma candidum]|uniref:Uncharacterized protein n=1 Tax=Melastoma candidum TaxID=119954 RepID=A0ACB9QQN8_9MYRT|nr:hypothetical protein MLD38_017454 [Melastoma candidum]
MQPIEQDSYADIDAAYKCLRDRRFGIKESDVILLGQLQTNSRPGAEATELQGAQADHLWPKGYVWLRHRISGNGYFTWQAAAVAMPRELHLSVVDIPVLAGRDVKSRPGVSRHNGPRRRSMDCSAGAVGPIIWDRSGGEASRNSLDR